MKHDKGWRANKDVDKCGITNADRADRVEDYLLNYMTGRDGDCNYTPEDERSYCSDMIADLLHLAASKGWNAEKILRMADTHFQAER